jgi:DNA-binding transcriptional regulator YhcF (GntR family)
MDITLDIDDENPMFKQLITQIKEGVMTSRLEPGHPLPSIRQLANDLGINQNTVAKAYRLLERDKVIVAKGYKGTFIHDDAVVNSKTNLPEHAAILMQETISNLRKIGLTDSEIRIAFASVMKS